VDEALDLDPHLGEFTMNRRAFVASLSVVLLTAATPSLFANAGPDYTWTSPGDSIKKNTAFTPSIDVKGTLDVTPTHVRFKVYSGTTVLQTSDTSSISLIEGDINGLVAVYSCNELGGIATAGTYVIRCEVWYNNADPDTTAASDTLSHAFSVTN